MTIERYIRIEREGEPDVTVSEAQFMADNEEIDTTGLPMGARVVEGGGAAERATLVVVPDPSIPRGQYNRLLRSRNITRAYALYRTEKMCGWAGVPSVGNMKLALRTARRDARRDDAVRYALALGMVYESQKAV